MGPISQCCLSSSWRAMYGFYSFPSLSPPCLSLRQGRAQCAIFCQCHDLQYLSIHSVHWHWLSDEISQEKESQTNIFTHKIQSGLNATLHKSNQYKITWIAGFTEYVHSQPHWQIAVHHYKTAKMLPKTNFEETSKLWEKCRILRLMLSSSGTGSLSFPGHTR